MASLFIGNEGLGLRQQYTDLTNAAISATTGQSDALLLCSIRQAARLSFFFNSTSFDLSLYLCHPKQDSTIATNRLFWMEFPANFNLNYDSGSVNWEFDPGTKIYVAKAGGTSTVGKFRVVLWG